MKITLDEREVGLYERILSLHTGLVIVKQVLQIGDAILSNDDDKEFCIFERKTLQDLSSSIKDGRYEVIDLFIQVDCLLIMLFILLKVTCLQFIFFLSAISPMKYCNSMAITYDDWVYVETRKMGIKSQIRSLYEQQEADTKMDCTDAISALRTHYDDVAKSPKTIYDV